MSHMLINIGTVLSVVDDSDGGRIKVKTKADKFTSESLQFDAFPLLPKMFQTAPKVGEAVLVIYSQLGNSQSQRFYIGPIISQPQKQSEDLYNDGNGQTCSLFHGSDVKPFERISNYGETDGAFPLQSDVAIVGRNTEDIILKDGEIDIRCGIRTKANKNKDKPGLVGEVIFNSQNPSYIQLKYRKNSNNQSVINLVADKINLVSNNRKLDEYINLTNVNSSNAQTNESLLKESDMDKLMEQLHEVPYGDILVQVLETFRTTFLQHVHNYNLLPPCQEDNVKKLTAINFNEMLSPDIKIS